MDIYKKDDTRIYDCVYYVYFTHNLSDPYCCFSHRHISPFTHTDGISYISLEQYMLKEKALLFNVDGQNITLIDDIMKAKSHFDMINLYPLIKGYDKQTWHHVLLGVLNKGNMMKFTQNKHLLELLISTRESIVVYSDSVDQVLGIGIDYFDGMCKNDWNGLNLMGKSLIHIRDTLTC